MNELAFAFGDNLVRTVKKNGNPWFVAKDIAQILEYETAKDMCRNLDDDEKDGQIVPTLGGNQTVTVISESGLYHSIFQRRRNFVDGSLMRFCPKSVKPEVTALPCH